MARRVEGKVALVTGAGAGLGAASAVMLAREGATVVLSDIQPEGGEATLARILDAGGAGMFHQQDVTSEAGWEELIDLVLDRYGRLDIVLNSAGIGSGSSIEDATYEHFKQINDVNYGGVFLGTKHGVKGIRRSGNGGSIINISSIEGIIGDPDLAAYNGSKGAVRAMSKSAALHCAKQGYGIRVNTIHPGHIMTKMVIDYFNGQPDSEAAWADIKSRYPIGHLGEPDDVGYAVLYLASDESKFMTGSELVIDGGYTAQ